MRSILVLNQKGGCGKTTLVTNLAGYFAEQGKVVAIADFDPQGCSIDWLAERPKDRPEIIGIEAWDSVRVPKEVEYLIMDAPARIAGKELSDLVRRAETAIVPVLPSPLDMRAADRFVEQLNSVRRVVNDGVRLASVANRVRDRTVVAHQLDDYLSAWKLPSGNKFPFLTALRASQNYIKAAERGLSIFEFSPAATEVDRQQWEPLLRWIKSARSRP